MRQSSVTIIGGGPAGLIAAERLAQAGAQATVYDSKPSVGRKFLMAGRGGLNLTHSEPLSAFLKRYSTINENFLSAIHRFPPDELRAWCEGLGQETFTGSSGRVFPKAMKASPLLRAWLARLAKSGVQFRLQRRWAGWDATGALVFETPDGPESIKADAVLLALGGASWPGLGSDGMWAGILKAQGIPVKPLLPSNCGFAVDWSPVFRTQCAGQPLKNIRLLFAGQSTPGEIIITEKGIEGGAVYALSAAIREAIIKEGKAIVMLDLHPNLAPEALLKKLQAPRGRKSFSTYVQKALNLSPVATALLREADRNIQDRSPADLAALIKAFPLHLVKPFGIDRAISSAGGISFDALDNNFMLKDLPGVFAAGEMLDWEAPTGGYLLQGCFATGRAAADGIIKFLGI